MAEYYAQQAAQHAQIADYYDGHWSWPWGGGGSKEGGGSENEKMIEAPEPEPEPQVDLDAFIASKRANTKAEGFTTTPTKGDKAKAYLGKKAGSLFSRAGNTLGHTLYGGVKFARAATGAYDTEEHKRNDQKVHDDYVVKCIPQETTARANKQRKSLTKKSRAAFKHGEVAEGQAYQNRAAAISDDNLSDDEFASIVKTCKKRASRRKKWNKFK